MNLDKNASINYKKLTEGTEVILNYKNLWEEKSELMCNLLLYLTNHKSQNLFVIDFETFPRAPYLSIVLDVNKKMAKVFTIDMINYIGLDNEVEIKELIEVDVYEVEFKDEDYDNRKNYKPKFLKVNLRY